MLYQGGLWDLVLQCGWRHLRFWFDRATVSRHATSKEYVLLIVEWVNFFFGLRVYKKGSLTEKKHRWLECVKFQIFIAVNTKNIIFLHVTPCSLVYVCRSFVRTSSFHLQSWRLSRSEKKAEIVGWVPWNSGPIGVIVSKISHVKAQNISNTLS